MIKKKELTKEVGHHLDKGVDLPDPILHSPTRLISASMGIQDQALPGNEAGILNKDLPDSGCRCGNQLQYLGVCNVL